MTEDSTRVSSTSNIDDLYHEAYALVDQGICYDEVGQRDGALAMYERGLQLIDAAGQLEGVDYSPLYEKMIRAREHILFRLKDLRSGSNNFADLPANLAPERPPRPSVERTTVPPVPPPPYESIDSAIDAFGDSKSAEELFLIPGGVQIFFIRGDHTSVPSYPDSLKIFKFREDSNEASESGAVPPPAFLQVGDWVYPLVLTGSPILHSNYGAYIFPNPTVDEPDLHVGIILPHDLDPSTKESFSNTLKQLTSIREQEQPLPLDNEEKLRLSSKISKLLVSTGELLAWGVEVSAEKAAHLVSKQTAKMRVGEKSDKEMVVDPRVRTSVHYLRKGSKVAVKCSGYLVDKIGEMAVSLGKHVASKITKGAADENKQAGGFVSGTFEVLGSGITSAATVWMGCEDAARSLAKSIANDTVLVVDHKYGADAGGLVNDAFYTAGHSTMTALNIHDLGAKAIAKRTAKKAGLGLLSDLAGGSKELKEDHSKPDVDNEKAKRQ